MGIISHRTFFIVQTISRKRAFIKMLSYIKIHKMISNELHGYQIIVSDPKYTMSMLSLVIVCA